MAAVLGCGTAGAEDKASPHGVPGQCSACHVLPENDLNGFFTGKSRKKELKFDPITVCRHCHESGFGHGVGMKPAMNRENLPLDKGEAITCATTCHNMHLKSTEDQLQGHYHLRLPVDRLCFSCHDK